MHTNDRDYRRDPLLASEVTDLADIRLGVDNLQGAAPDSQQMSLAELGKAVGVPPGGAAGSSLTKCSASDYDSDWKLTSDNRAIYAEEIGDDTEVILPIEDMQEKRAFKFAAGTRVTCGADGFDPLASPTFAFTVSFWMKASVASNEAMISQSWNNSDGWTIGTIANRPRVAVKVNGAAEDTQGIVGQNCVTSTWRHVIAMIEEDGVTLWVQGIKQAKNPASLGGATGNVGTVQPIILGYSTQNAWNYTGSLSDVRIFNDVITDEQAAAIYANDTSIALPAYVLHQPCVERHGKVARDISGNGRDGVISGHDPTTFFFSDSGVPWTEVPTRSVALRELINRIHHHEYFLRATGNAVTDTANFTTAVSSGKDIAISGRLSIDFSQNSGSAFVLNQSIRGIDEEAGFYFENGDFGFTQVGGTAALQWSPGWDPTGLTYVNTGVDLNRGEGSWPHANTPLLEVGDWLVIRTSKTSSAFTSSGSGSTLTSAGHGFVNGQICTLSSTGTLPSGLSGIASIYYIQNVTANTFEVTRSYGTASEVISSAGSGAHTCTITKEYELRQVDSITGVFGLVVTDDAASTFTCTGHPFDDGDSVYLAGTVPTGGSLVADTRYYIINATTNTFQLATAAGGAALTFTGNGSGMTAYTKQVNIHPVSGNYAAAQVHTASLRTGVAIRDLKFECDPTSYVGSAFWVNQREGLEVENVRLKRDFGGGIYLGNGLANYTVRNVVIEGLHENTGINTSYPTYMPAYNSYGILLGGNQVSGLISDCIIRKTRHAIDTAGSFLHATHILISNCVSDGIGAIYDTHRNGYDITFNNCTSRLLEQTRDTPDDQNFFDTVGNGNGSIGISPLHYQMRARFCKITNATIFGGAKDDADEFKHNQPAIAFTATATGGHVANCRLENVSAGINFTADQCVATNNTIIDSQSYGIGCTDEVNVFIVRNNLIRTLSTTNNANEGGVNILRNGDIVTDFVASGGGSATVMFNTLEGSGSAESDYGIRNKAGDKISFNFLTGTYAIGFILNDGLSGVSNNVTV